MGGLSIDPTAGVNRRTVVVCLPVAAWRFLETEADILNNNLSAHVSSMLLCALQVQGREPVKGDLVKERPS